MEKYILDNQFIFQKILKLFKSYLFKSSSSEKISRAIIKYGYTNFTLTILEYCDKSNLVVREQYYFYELKQQYNILKIAGNSLNSKHTE